MENTKLVNKLIELNYKISCAESCTGGMLASSLVEVSDASKVFDMSFVTYSNESKIKLLDVSPSVIAKYGVVSEEVAKQMALGVQKKAESNIGVGISGIAGPKGGTIDKPVGMVCFGIVINGKIHTYTEYFGEIGRQNVREKSVEFVINKILELLN